MNISYFDLLRLKREAKKLRTLSPNLSHSERLSQVAVSMFGVRGFHELKKFRELTINQHIVLSESQAKCTYCGSLFYHEIAEERKAHQTRHDAFEEATEVLNYVPKLHAEREASKVRGHALLLDANLEQKLLGALMVIRAWFDRSLDSAIDKKYWKQHPSIDQYISYITGNLDLFPVQVVDILVERYGRNDGVIPKGQSYWRPLRH